MLLLPCPGLLKFFFLLGERGTVVVMFVLFCFLPVTKWGPRILLCKVLCESQTPGILKHENLQNVQFKGLRVAHLAIFSLCSSSPITLLCLFETDGIE